MISLFLSNRYVFSTLRILSGVEHLNFNSIRQTCSWHRDIYKFQSYWKSHWFIQLSIRARPIASSCLSVLLASWVFVVSVHGPGSSAIAIALKKSRILSAGLFRRSSSVALVNESRVCSQCCKGTGSTSKCLVTAGTRDCQSAVFGFTIWKAAQSSWSCVIRRVRTISVITFAVTS